MRRLGGTTNGVRVKAFAGTTGVLLAMNVGAPARKGLLGFAIERETMSGKFKGSKKWLDAMLDFPGIPHNAGEPVPTNKAPVQKFRWSDYTVFPGVDYRYTIHPVRGEAGDLDIQDGPKVSVTTMGPDSEHYVIFNRAAAASQAFARSNPKDAVKLWLAEQKKKKGRDPFANISFTPEAYNWLSRGLLETIVGFINDTGDAMAIDVAIYEFQHPGIRAAIAAAAKRGVTVRLLHHAKGDKTSLESEKAIKASGLRALGVDVIKRKTSKLMHNKFMVRSKLSSAGKRTATAALFGSTNFTDNGVYRQGNVVHIARNADIGARYLEQFERLVTTAEDASETKKETSAANPIDKTARIFDGFSPRAKRDDLDYFVKIIDGAKRDLLFTTVFLQIVPDILTAMLGKPHDDVIRIGLQNTATKIIGVHKDRSALFVTPAFLNTGLEGWLKESKYDQEGNILIHCKIIIANFTSDAPTLISGSHNFTNPASNGNDENYVVMKCSDDLLDVADAYGVEVMRLYDHYRFRWLAKQPKKTASGKLKKDNAPYLSLDDSWTDDYFGGDTMKTADRNRFCP